MRVLVQMLVALAVVVYTALPMPVAASLNHAAMQPAPHQHHAGMPMALDDPMAQHYHGAPADDAAPKGKAVDPLHCAICLCAAWNVPGLSHHMRLRSAPLPAPQRSLIAIEPAPQERPPRS